MTEAEMQAAELRAEKVIEDLMRRDSNANEETIVRRAMMVLGDDPAILEYSAREMIRAHPWQILGLAIRIKLKWAVRRLWHRRLKGVG